MVNVRTLVPLTHPTTGESFATDTEVDVADDVAAGWKADGKISLIADEEAAAKAANEGIFNAVTVRAEDSAEEPKSRKGG